MKGFSLYQDIKVQGLSRRYFPPDLLYDFISDLPTWINVSIGGYSVGKLQIPVLRLGRGPVKVMMWSQMHGNESTTTRALMDLIREWQLRQPAYLKEIELLIIPMVNPDGALAYTRINENGIDLNRDAQELSQPESRVLRSQFEEFKPDYCFNLHDQRTIYGVSSPPQSATLSFLAPSANQGRSFTESRSRAARLIAWIVQECQSEIGIGRYDDTFNLDCVGDTLQAAGVPTILVEAGHYPEDYERETTRFYVYRALKRALEGLASKSHLELPLTEYLAIPSNRSAFVDILVYNAERILPDLQEGATVGLQFQEVLKEGKILFLPIISEKEIIPEIYGHRTMDALKIEDLKVLKSMHFLQ